VNRVYHGYRVAVCLIIKGDRQIMIEDIRYQFVEGNFEFSKHAIDQSTARQIRVQEVRKMIVNGEIIEDYPNDKYGASCLICWFTLSGHPLHIQCSYPSCPLLKIIALDEPNKQFWSVNFTRRKFL
jgi:hypothetical protein